MKSKILTILLIFICVPAYSYFENYYSNFYSPIPPACVTNLQVWDDFNYSGSQVLAEGIVDWVNIYGEDQEMELRIKQKGCPDSNRRVLSLEVKLLDNFDGFLDTAYPPYPSAKIQGDAKRYRLRLNNEPNTNYAADNVSGVVIEGRMFEFFLDTDSPLAEDFDPDFIMTALQYNGTFTLDLDDFVNSPVRVSIPAYANNLGAASMSLTGRLSGNWVSPGAKDQGFVLAFEEIANAYDGLLFMSWYTYDNSGNLLWLTGANTFEPGDSQVSFDIELVTNGQFLGPKTADREVVGTGTIVARNCNDVRLTYNLDRLGLGSGTLQLRRLFSLETQGYSCGDFDTKIEHINDGS